MTKKQVNYKTLSESIEYYLKQIVHYGGRIERAIFSLKKTDQPSNQAFYEIQQYALRRDGFKSINWKSNEEFYPEYKEKINLIKERIKMHDSQIKYALNDEQFSERITIIKNENLNNILREV